jgi:hypothetical protein
VFPWSAVAVGWALLDSNQRPSDYEFSRFACGPLRPSSLLLGLVRVKRVRTFCVVAPCVTRFGQV